MNIQDFLDNVQAEEHRNDRFLHLTPNEPYMSETARRFMGSRLHDRYYFGAGEEGVIDFGAYTGLGYPAIGALVEAAEDATKEMLDASVVNLNFLSGVHAMMCAILSTTKPGEMVMSVPCTELNVKALYLDVSYCVNAHNLQEIREALPKATIIIYDASHTMGLTLGQQFQDPFSEGADVICANTHKTLPGPQKGMIAFKDEQFGNKANEIIGDLYSSPHTTSMIALAVALLEMKAFGEAYAQQVVANSNALGSALADLGFTVRKANTGRYSENHQVHLMTGELGNYRELYEQFIKNSITLAFDHPDVFYGGPFIRLGTQEITRRGMKEYDMQTIASLLQRSLAGEYIANDVEQFIDQFRDAHYSFDVV